MPTPPAAPPTATTPAVPRGGLAFDIEIDAQSRLTALGAWVEGRPHIWRIQRAADAAAALRELDELARGAAFVLGHNIYWHDLPWLQQNAPKLGLLHKPAVDTLLLSGLAFAEHPYHALVKDYKLVRDAVNDPSADARLATRLLCDAHARLCDLGQNRAAFVRVVQALATRGAHVISAAAGAGTAMILSSVQAALATTATTTATTTTGTSAHLDADLHDLLDGRVCRAALARLLPLPQLPDATCLAMAFAVAWLRVAAGTDSTSASVPLAWVRRHLPETTDLLDRLRAAPCADAACDWCRTVHNPQGQLRRWFGHDDFRSRPQLADGRAAQRAIVQHGFDERPLLALLPTGGGKSICFQLPAIARYQRRGALTIVLSPLQALMRDQVTNFTQKTGAQIAVELTGMLTPPERRATLEAVSSGSAGLLYISPEQLRNRSFQSAIQRREIGAWVFDEAHCLSKWGHDFRPDYLYAARFVREHAARQGVPPPPIICVTATAKPEVREELLQHFADELGVQLEVFDGHAERENLTLSVEHVSLPEKSHRLQQLVAETLIAEPSGSVLVYTATRRGAEQAAAQLLLAGLDARAFHAGLDPETKKDVQRRFLAGEHRVVTATNAFGMGIDKPDIRLVVHHDVPGSLEAYVQEVGRAGRDGAPARAVLLFADDDIETQFRLAASSRLHPRELQAILRRIRRLARPSLQSEVRETICTTGELLRDAAADDGLDYSQREAPTRVVTAIAWLERARFLRRDENSTAVFQGRPLCADLEEARQRIDALGLPPHKAAAWLQILARLISADADEGFSSDDLLGLPAVGIVVGTLDAATAGRQVLRILLDMQSSRLLSTGVLMTAFVRRGIADDSADRLHAAIRVEQRLLETLCEAQPDLDQEQCYHLRLPPLIATLAADEPAATPDLVRTVLMANADRARYAPPTAAGLAVSFTARDHCTVRVRGDWQQIRDGATRRHLLAALCLQVLLQQLPPERRRGATLLVEFSLELLVKAMHDDLVLRSQPSPDPATEIEYALLFLHRIEALVLHRGLAVFRQAMVLRLPAEATSRRFTGEDFAPLGLHQEQRTTQVHAMHEFVQRMLATPVEGLQLLDDYFSLPSGEFYERWFAGRTLELQRSTGPTSFHRIVQTLSPEQRRIVEAAEDESLLVLAGPGSGKTRVVVHRCAWLLRVRRVPAGSILVLCYNRSAALELRQRLRALVGDDMNGVLVQTYHGMAARLCGRAPGDLLDAGDPTVAFDDLLRAAVASLEGTADHPEQPAEPDPDREQLRERLLAGFRHILVDEYQDIDELQYRLVSAIAGRTLHDPELRLAVLAVGDDDQNVYQWRGSNVDFLRRFETDYGARRMPLLDNYRSTAAIVDVANRVIGANRDRLKADVPLRIDRARRDAPAGGPFAALDPLVAGRVHIVQCSRDDQQAEVVVRTLRHLQRCDGTLSLANCAVLAPRHALLDQVRYRLEHEGIAVRQRVDGAHAFSLYRLREVQELLAAVEARRGAALDATAIDAAALRDELHRLQRRRQDPLTMPLLEQLVDAFVAEFGAGKVPRRQVREFFGELLLEQRRERTLGHGVLLATVHGSKGSEYDHVIVLDGGWLPRRHDNGTLGDLEEVRRLYYVAMTRARHTLTLLQTPSASAAWLPCLDGPHVLRSTMPAAHGTPPLPTVRYERLGLADLWLSFAGRDAQHTAIAAAIDALSSGAELALAPRGDGTFVVDAHGQRVGALSKRGAERLAQRLPQLRRVRVAAVLERCAAHEAEPYRDGLLRERWMVVVPELLFAE